MKRLSLAWASATVRGRAFVLVGVFAVVGGLDLRERQIVRVGFLLIALTAVAGVLLARTRRRLHTTAVLSATRVVVGRPVTVRVTVSPVGRVASGPVGIRVDAPDGIGGGGLVLAEHRPGSPAVAEVVLAPAVRGRYTLPPVRVEVRDALGLCRLERPATAALPFTVLPHTEVLRGSLPAAGTVTRGAGGSRATGIAGDADTTVREYRSGDDRRRVHWRSSARLGELMVRGEEQQRQAAVTVLLDNRAGAHRLGGPFGAGGTFEWAVSATASLVRHLLLAGHEVRLVGPPRPDRPDRSAQAGGRSAAARTLVELERLVDARCVGEKRNRMHPVASILPPADTSVLVAVLGAVIDADLPALRAARTGRADALAVLLDVDSWELGMSPDAATARRHIDHSAAVLRRAGWRTVVVERGSTAAAAWAAVTAPGGHAQQGRPVAGTRFAGPAARRPAFGPQNRPGPQVRGAAAASAPGSPEWARADGRPPATAAAGGAQRSPHGADR